MNENYYPEKATAPKPMKDYSTCPNCSAKIKSGVFGNNQILSQQRIDLINEFEKPGAEAYCDDCGSKIMHGKIRPELTNERARLKARAEELINSIPVISLQSPFGWDYVVKGMVTGQSTTGTGVFSEMFSSVTDLFGAQSGSYNNKLKNGEDLCFAQLRKAALELGANAVIATDIDYSEVGGDKGMLMVCMAGTAIVLKNTDVLGGEMAASIDELNKTYQDLTATFKTIKRVEAITQ